MTKDNYQNDLPCRFAETLVAVLYGEASAAERQAFKKHFNDCHVCRDELTSFGSIRDLVAEWRTTDFDSIKIPHIVLLEIAKTSETQAPQTSWSERIRSLIFSGGQLDGAMVFAAIAVCAVLLAIFGYAVANRLVVREVEVAGVSNVARTEPTASVPATTPSVTAIPKDDAKQSVTISESKVESPTKQTQAPVAPAIRPIKPNAASPILPHQLIKPEKTPTVKNQTAPKTPELAIESVDEMEDHSLRLSDLLDEEMPST